MASWEAGGPLQAPSLFRASPYRENAAPKWRCGSSPAPGSSRWSDRPDRSGQARTGKCYPLVVIQEAGLDGFWIDRVLRQEDWIEGHVVDAASIAVSRRRRRAKTDGIDGETLVRTLMAYRRGVPRVCSMVRVPMLEDEDRRRLSRERKMLIAELIEHSNRIKGLLFSQGIRDCEALRRDRRKRLDELRTGMTGRCLTASRPRSTGNSTVSNCCLHRSRPWRPSGTRC